MRRHGDGRDPSFFFFFFFLIVLPRFFGLNGDADTQTRGPPDFSYAED